MDGKPRYLGQYSDQSKGWPINVSYLPYHMKQFIFFFCHKLLDQHWGPPSLLFDVCWQLFPRA